MKITFIKGKKEISSRYNNRIRRGRSDDDRRREPRPKIDRGVPRPDSGRGTPPRPPPAEARRST
ncbi:UNVERIFIED_CONTAM: hypothetical protein Sradi_6872300 [Sesamum radiatum]|uniref:Uncharacterized protein n=1 Tax=Sesamum radiatum TaxID=300843 RepID=A0AAW2JJ42_SESRA